MKKYTLFPSAILTILLIAGCTAVPPATKPTETTAPTHTVPSPTTTAPVSMPSTVDIETLFGDYDSWYACALTSLYESPENIDLYMFFRYGFEDEPSNYTDEEWQLLKTYWGFSHSSPSIRLPAKKMDSVLQEFFGLTLAETCGIGLENFVYLESTDCYYRPFVDFPQLSNFSIRSMNAISEKVVQIRYTLDSEPLQGKVGILTVQIGSDSSLKILSNLQESAPATGEPDPFANLPLETPEDCLDIFSLMDDLNPWDHSNIKVIYRLSLLRSYFLKDPEMFIKQMPNDPSRLYHLVTSLRYALRPEDLESVKAICRSMRADTALTDNERLAATMVLEQLITSDDEREAILKAELENRTEITDFTTAIVRFGVPYGYAPQAVPDFYMYTSYEKFSSYRDSLFQSFPESFNADIADVLCPQSYREVTETFDESFFEDNVLIQIYLLVPKDSLPKVTGISGKTPDMVVGSLLVHLEYDPENLPDRDDMADRMIFISVPKHIYQRYAYSGMDVPRYFSGIDRGVSITENGVFFR